MALFRKAQQSPQPRSFDGIAGRQELERLVHAFLTAAGSGYIEPVGDIAQSIHMATPGDPNAKVGPGFLIAPWKWIAAVAHRAETDGSHALAGQIGLMTEIWNRQILKEDPRYQFGRLVDAPIDIEQEIYKSALRSLTKLQPGDVIIGGGTQGWTASEAVNQLTASVDSIAQSGGFQDPELLALARGGARFDTNMRGVDPGNNTSGRRTSVAADIDEGIADAEAGDRASDRWLRGLHLQMNGGDAPGALKLFEEAAGLGHVKAMFDAGCVARDLGESQTAQFWWATGADAGSADSAWNLAIMLLNGGDIEGAASYYKRCAELGDTRGFAALTQLANNAGDGAAEASWAQLGADAGEPFCMFRHGLRLAMNANGDEPTLRAAREYLESAADRGNIDAMGMAANVNAMLGDRARSQRFVDMTVKSGDAEAIDRLRRHGYL